MKQGKKTRQVLRGQANALDLLHEKSYNNLMSGNYASFLAAQSYHRVLRVIFESRRQRSFREIVELSGLSVGGTQDALRRLKQSQLIRAERKGKKIYYSLCVSRAEEKILSAIFDLARRENLEQQRQECSAQALPLLEWIEETLKSVAAIKKNNRDALKSAKARS